MGDARVREGRMRGAAGAEPTEADVVASVKLSYVMSIGIVECDGISLRFTGFLRCKWPSTGHGLVMDRRVLMGRGPVRGSPWAPRTCPWCWVLRGRKCSTTYAFLWAVFVCPASAVGKLLFRSLLILESPVVQHLL